jgi:hypothetical protein
MEKKSYLVIKDMKTQEEVKRIDVTGKNDRMRERVLHGLLTQMDRNKYVVDEIEE